MVFEIRICGDHLRESFHHSKLGLDADAMCGLQDWPQKWQSFIPDLVAASKTNETLCENSMYILKLLSEEIFDFSQGELTQVRPAACCNQIKSEAECLHTRGAIYPDLAVAETHRLKVPIHGSHEGNSATPACQWHESPAPCVCEVCLNSLLTLIAHQYATLSLGAQQAHAAPGGTC